MLKLAFTYYVVVVVVFPVFYFFIFFIIFLFLGRFCLVREEGIQRLFFFCCCFFVQVFCVKNNFFSEDHSGHGHLATSYSVLSHCSLRSRGHLATGRVSLQIAAD